MKAMKIFSKKGFTIVELVVVITILTILVSISFVAYSGHLSESRDTKRIIDVETVATALETRYKKTGKYPAPANAVILSYTWSDGLSKPFSYLGFAKEEGLLGMNAVPTDPLTEDSYPYGITVSGKSYEIAATLENASKVPRVASVFFSEAHAAENGLEEVAYVFWNYRYDPTVGNFFPHLVILEEGASHPTVPSVDVNVGVQSAAGSGILVSSGFLVAESGKNNVPYPVFVKKEAAFVSTGSTDFIVSATGAVIECPGCQ